MKWLWMVAVFFTTITIVAIVCLADNNAQPTVQNTAFVVVVAACESALHFKTPLNVKRV